MKNEIIETLKTCYRIASYFAVVISGIYLYMAILTHMVEHGSGGPATTIGLGVIFFISIGGYTVKFIYPGVKDIFAKGGKHADTN